MGIDLRSENTLSLGEAARLVPSSRQGRATHVSRILRWILTGRQGPDGRTVRLEALRLGGHWVTSVEALQRFAEALTPESETRTVVRTSTLRSRAAEAAARELDRLGI